MFDGATSIDGMNNAFDKLLTLAQNVASADTLSGSSKAKIETLGLDLAMIKTGVQANAAVFKAENEMMQVAINMLGSSDIQDTAEISEAYYQKMSVLNS